jgi:hypothetical protein
VVGGYLDLGIGGFGGKMIKRLKIHVLYYPYNKYLSFLMRIPINNSKIYLWIT